MLRAIAWLIVVVAALLCLWGLAYLWLGDHLADAVALMGLSAVCLVTYFAGR